MSLTPFNTILNAVQDTANWIVKDFIAGTNQDRYSSSDSSDDDSLSSQLSKQSKQQIRQEREKLNNELNNLDNEE